MWNRLLLMERAKRIWAEIWELCLETRFKIMHFIEYMLYASYAGII